MKIVVLGSSGMLGNAVTKELSKEPGFEITATARDRDLLRALAVKHKIKFDCTETGLPSLPHLLDGTDYVVNCIGIIKPFIDNSITDSIFINSLFPHILTEYGQRYGAKVINITTDCVFSGRKGSYVETDEHDQADLYGQSKSLGESKESLTIRTSIIGDEIHKHASLIAWVKNQKGKNIKGFTNHTWNGITTNTYGQLCRKIINEDLYKTGIFHVFSPSKVNKFELVSLINERYRLGITIDPAETDAPCDRSMDSIFDLCKTLSVPDLRSQILSL